MGVTAHDALWVQRVKYHFVVEAAVRELRELSSGSRRHFRPQSEAQFSFRRNHNRYLRVGSGSRSRSTRCEENGCTVEQTPTLEKEFMLTGARATSRGVLFLPLTRVTEEVGPLHAGIPSARILGWHRHNRRENDNRSAGPGVNER
jgi:hypothetical protein